MKLTLRELCLLVALSAAGVTITGSPGVAEEDTPISPDFTRYEQTDAFKAVVALQSHPRGRLLAISSFHGGDRVTLQYSVDKNGKETDRRFVYAHATQASRGKQLTAEELKELGVAIAELPAENVAPPIERLVIVNFRQDDQWIMRSYDRKEPPKAIQRIYEIIGERFESKQDE